MFKTVNGLHTFNKVESYLCRKGETKSFFQRPKDLGFSQTINQSISYANVMYQVGANKTIEFDSISELHNPVTY